jgi:hypothetical protein
MLPLKRIKERWTNFCKHCFLGINGKSIDHAQNSELLRKINRKYFEGDFSSLSQWLGTDLIINKIQNMLLGQQGLMIWQREIGIVVGTNVSIRWYGNNEHKKSFF